MSNELSEFIRIANDTSGGMVSNSTISRRPIPTSVFELPRQVFAANVEVGTPAIGPSDDQKWILDELPGTSGHYWVENIQTNERNVAFIDKSIFLGTVDHWGCKMDATLSGISVIERWLTNWIILDMIEPYNEPEKDNTFGMF